MNTQEQIRQNLSTPSAMPGAYVVLASAATIAPTSFLTELTGTTDITTITVPYTGFIGMLAFLFSNGAPGDFLTGGNIAKAKSPVTLEVVIMFYNGTSWYPQMV